MSTYELRSLWLFAPQCLGVTSLTDKRVWHVDKVRVSHRVQTFARSTYGAVRLRRQREYILSDRHNGIKPTTQRPGAVTC